MALGELKNGIGPDAYAIYQQVLAAVVERDHPVGSLYISENATSPAELYGGTWEQVAADRALMGASSTHPAGTTEEAGLPNVWGQINSLLCLGKATADSGSAIYPTWAADAGSQPLSSGTAYPYAAQFNIGIDLNRSNEVFGKSGTVQPPAYYTYVWRRIE